METILSLSEVKTMYPEAITSLLNGDIQDNYSGRDIVTLKQLKACLEDIGGYFCVSDGTLFFRDEEGELNDVWNPTENRWEEAR